MKDNETFKEIIAYAKTLGMSTDEYLIYLHQKNQAVKTILLNDSEGFRQFLKEFHDVMDDLTLYDKDSVEEVVAIRKEKSLQASIDLLTNVSSDPMLLAQMYEHYQYDSDEDTNTIMNKK
ncbi:hypothetical protein [Marinilactibacillus kalidii]|uniref:hypothetical protein n=1 Tax=Marinilactibacillus kalidii TaxID=2820274 RepID=UPI001ABDF394|nr:hypothetical protein [Marinilactibacillus kalidii]